MYTKSSHKKKKKKNKKFKINYDYYFKIEKPKVSGLYFTKYKQGVKEKMLNVEQLKDREAVNARIIELLEELNIIPQLDFPETQAAQEPVCQITQERV